MSMLILGSNGMLGGRLAEALPEANAIGRAQIDFLTADERSIEKIIAAFEPSIIINAAAYTAVDAAEKEPDIARRVNGFMPGLLARIAAGHAIPFIHFSTDYVFDGAAGKPYVERDATRPLNIYGETKLAGEQAALAAGAHVFRLQSVFDARGNNFFKRLMQFIATQSELRIAADQIAAPTHAAHVAQAVMRMLPLIQKKTLPAGVYHLAAAGHTSRHGFACAVAEAMRTSIPIAPITTAEFPVPATRPRDTRLDCSALASHGITLPHWREGLAKAMEEL
jgi:dTDP-4-dehydrorhamnose reductase